MAEQLEVTVNLTNQKVQFTGIKRGHPIFFLSRENSIKIFYFIISIC